MSASKSNESRRWLVYRERAECPAYGMVRAGGADVDWSERIEVMPVAEHEQAIRDINDELVAADEWRAFYVELREAVVSAIDVLCAGEPTRSIQAENILRAALKGEHR